MEYITFDKGWVFRRAFTDSLGMLDMVQGHEVNLPHDGMIGTEVSADAPAQVDSGYYNGDICSYTKYVEIPAEWENDHVGLKFDGAMIHAVIDINGCKTGEHHYGYSPFYIDISRYISFGKENRITININTGVQPSSRWYTGSGLFRGVMLCHSPKVHIQDDGIFVYTKEVSDDMAFLGAKVDICNDTSENRLVEVVASIFEDGSEKTSAESRRVIQVNPNSIETAEMQLNLKNPKLWDIDHPELYIVKVKASDIGTFRTHLEKNGTVLTDEAGVLFGVRTITADAVRGLQINKKTVKLKGGCIHHDNGLLGAVSLYEIEARKILKLKELGFNAIRTAHNPPSAALVEACDRLGMYIFDEAFDAWGMGKRPGDYSMYFESAWKQDMTAFVRRDRVHPSVIMWSTGNEIPERGGLDNGYTVASRLAQTIKQLDTTRPVSNGICSLWSGLDDYLAKGQNQNQNAKGDEINISWEKATEPFTNGLDVVGYNYMEDLYEKDHEMFPERVILGSENFPKEIGFRWPMVEALPYVIGEFTWTAWDYIGEAGIGKSAYVAPDDPLVEKGPWALMPQYCSPFPWRTANDADIDITGGMRPQGAYRSVIWGSEKTHLYVQHPKNFGKTEVIGMWGFTDVIKCWNFDDYTGKPVELVVFSNGDEVELLLNGRPVERKKVGNERPLPKSVRFQTLFEAGRVEAVSYRNGVEISRDAIETTGKPVGIRLVPERAGVRADGHDAVYVRIEVTDTNGAVVPDASVKLEASYTGPGTLAGFGTANPVTSENYTMPETVSFHGLAAAVIRSGYEAGTGKLTVRADLSGVEENCEIQIG